MESLLLLTRRRRRRSTIFFFLITAAATTPTRRRSCCSSSSSSRSISALVPAPPPPPPAPNPSSLLLLLPQRLAQLGLDPASIRSILALPPPLFHDLPRKIELFSTLGLSPSELKRFVSRPCFRYLCRLSYSTLVPKFNFLGKSSRRVLTRDPDVLKLGVPNLEGKLEYFKRLGLERHEFLAMLEQCPRIVKSKLETLQKRAAYLQGIGLATSDFPRMLRRFPLLCTPSETGLKPRLEFLQGRGARKETILKYLVLRPQFITLSIKNLTEKMDFLEQLGVDKNSHRFYPTLFTCCQLTCKRLQAGFDWLLCCGFSHDDAIYIVTTNPTILVCTAENLGKKIDYLVNVLNRDIQEIVRYPVFLGYSLEQRIIPRFDALARLEEKGMLEGDLSLQTVLACSSNSFRKRFVESSQRRTKRQK